MSYYLLRELDWEHGYPVWGVIKAEGKFHALQKAKRWLQNFVDCTAIQIDIPPLELKESVEYYTIRVVYRNRNCNSKNRFLHSEPEEFEYELRLEKVKELE